MTEDTFRVRIDKTNAHSIGFVSSPSVGVLNARGTGCVLLPKVLQTIAPMENYRLTSGLKRFAVNRLIEALTFGARILHKFGVESNLVLPTEKK
jgi:hypothetical protein